MRAFSVAAVFMAFASASAVAELSSGPTPAQTKPLVATVESRWSDVYCDLTEVSRTSANELNVRYQYRNRRKDAFRLPHADLVPRTRVFDPAGRTLFGVLNDAAGKPLSSTMLDGAVARPVPAGRTQSHWARLEAPAENVKTITVLVEGCLPFESVAIGGASAGAPAVTAPSAALATQDGEAEGIAVEVVRVARGPAALLTVVLRYRNTGAEDFRFPQAAALYVIDPASRKKFEIVQDKTGKPLASDTREVVGVLGETLKPGEALTVWAMFPAPSESTKTLSVYAPLAPPFDGVAVSGTGTGPGEGGTAVAGAVVGVDAALKDLGATVTDTEIRIELAADVLFDFDKADVKQEADASLERVATVLKAHPGAEVAIEGHTDGRGADAYNQKLSEARAASVKQWLVTRGQASAAKITTRGWGKTKPVASNTRPDGSDDPEGRAKNRRVEIIVRKGA